MVKEAPMKKALTAVIASGLLTAGLCARAQSVWDEPLPDIYWGDLHVHTNFSWDAYGYAMAPGVYTDEAGLYATYCAKLDFFAFTDHAEGLTDPLAWEKTIQSAQAYNAIGRSRPDDKGDPGVVAFVGFEWTHSVPWGHKNVIFKYDDPERITPGPIPCSRQIVSKSMEWSIVARTLWPGKKEAVDPARLFERLDRECVNSGSGCEVTVIPHGNAWGNANFRTDWDIQNNPAMLRPDIQRNIEIYSKHGNSEEYRPFPPDYRYYLDGREVSEDQCSGKSCEKVCQEPTEDYEPCCWRAGEIVQSRCADPDSDFCGRRVELARESMQVFPGTLTPGERKQIKPEFRKKPAKTGPADWRACGQCRTCYQPAWNYLPNSSVQKAMVTYGEDEDGNPSHFKFGFVGSTDTHQGRPGSVKEVKYFFEEDRPRGQGSIALLHSMPPQLMNAIGMEWGPGPERSSNFFNPGSLVAILSERRTGEDLFDNLEARRVYATSGPRIQVWLRAEVFPGQKRVIDMGEEAASRKNPVFHIKAQGAFYEDETCPYDDEPEIMANLSRDEFLTVCYNQCYRVLDERVPIARIEAVKILLPMTREEASMHDLRRGPENPGGLIMDPYHVHEFDGPTAQVEWKWSDPKFEKEAPGRIVAYYFRVVQVPTEGYLCNPAAFLEEQKMCRPKDPPSIEVDTKVNPQDGSEPAPRNTISDTCYTDPSDPRTFCEERAWTSPVYITRQ
jgi:hypothetical protein